MKEFIEELKYNQKINEEKGLENRIDIDYVIERLEDISVYEEFLKNEVNYNIEEMIENKDLDKKDIEKIKNLTEKDIEEIIDNVGNDDYVWGNFNESIAYFIEKQLE